MKKGKRITEGNFMKSVLKLSLWQLTLFTIWQMAVFTVTGNEASTLIQWFFTFWGIEVSLLMLKKVMEKFERKRSNKASNYDDSEVDQQ